MRWFIRLIAILIVLLSLGTASAEEQTGSITVYLQDIAGSITVYQTDAWADEDPDEMTVYIKNYDIQGITKSIAADKPTVFTNLPQGRYLVTHSENAFRPFLVTVPITVNGSSTLAVEARPKTQEPQSPQTGDSTDPLLLCAALFGVLMGIAGMTWVRSNRGESFSDGKMFSKRVQNEQKRLR